MTQLHFSSERERLINKRSGSGEVEERGQTLSRGSLVAFVDCELPYVGVGIGGPKWHKKHNVKLETVLLYGGVFFVQ